MNKFFADEATPAGGGAALDIAAALAKNGVMTTEDTAPEIPNIVISTHKEEKLADAEPAKSEPAPAPAPQETTIEKPVESAAPETVPAVSDWREELKRAEKAEILKELGFDERMIGFYNTWATGGDVGNYLKAVSIDYTKMTPEQLLKQQLFESYPEFSAEDLEELFRAKVVDQYKLDPEVYSEQEVRRGKLLLQADAKAIRESMIEKQKQYILSAKPPQMPDYRKEAEEQAKARDEANMKVLEEYKAALNNHPATKELVNNKRLVIGQGEDTFNYEVSDPGKALAVLQDPRLWAQSIWNADGTPNIERQLFLAAAVLDHEAVAREIFKAGKAIGAKQVIEPIENAKKMENPSTTSGPALTPAQALAKNGVLTHG